MTKQEILLHLRDSLIDLVNILRLDARCQWTEKFERDIEQASRITESGFSDLDIQSLSVSIKYVYQGMNSFNDYSPRVFNQKSGRYNLIPGAEKFEVVSQRVYDLATMLNECHS